MPVNIPPLYPNDWKSELKRMMFSEMKAKYPEAYKAGGGDTWNLNIPSEKTANGLTRLIMRFLKLKGHYANRVNTQGQMRGAKISRYEAYTNKAVYGNEARWVKGQTTRGTPDIDAIIYGRAVQIEVKIGKDKMSEHQIEQKYLIEEAGGLYFVARDMQSFYDWYYQNFSA